MFVVPWGDLTYIGTTDTDYDGPLDDPQCTPDDVDYLLGAINHAIIERAHRATTSSAPGPACARWSRDAGSERTADLSAPPPGDAVGQRHGHRHRRQAHDLPRDGRRHRRRRARAGARREGARARHQAQPHPAPAAARRRGLRGAGHLGVDGRAHRRRRPRPPGQPLRRRGPRPRRHDRGATRRWPSRSCRACPTCGPRRVYAARYEMARTVDDVLSRRTRARLLARDASAAAAADVAALVADDLGWDADARTARSTPTARRDRRADGRRAPRDDARASLEASALLSSTGRRRRPSQWTDLTDRSDRARSPTRSARTTGAAPDLGPAAPTPPIALVGRSVGDDGTARTARRRGPRRGAGAAAIRRLRVGDDRCRDRRRGQPRLVAAGHDLGARRPGRRRWPRPSLGPSTPTQVAASCASATSARIPVTAAGRTQRRVRLVACRSTAGSSSTCATSPASVASTTRRSTVDVRAGTFGDHFEARAAHRRTGSPCGHWPQSMTLSTVGGWLACRGAGQLSTRYGKIEDMVVGLDVVLADGTTAPHRRQRPPGRRAPTSTSCSSAARARSASSPARGCACTRRPPTSGGPPTASRRSPHGLDACRRDPAARRDARRAAALRRGRGRPQLPDRRRWRVLLVLDEGDPSIVDATIERRRGGVRRGGRPLDVDAGRAVAAAPQRRVAARAAHRRRPRRRHDGDHGTVGRARPPSTTAAVAAIRRCPARWPRRPTSRHAYPDGACLYFTFAGKPDADGQGRLLPRRVGRRHAGRARAGRLAQPPPRRRASTGPGSCPRRSAPASTCS